MILAEMPRKLPPNVIRERTRHGKVVFYFRRGKGPRQRLPAPTSPEFGGAYESALLGRQRAARAQSAAGSLEWLIDRYRETGKYLSLSYATRRQRDNIFKGVIASAGRTPYRSITRRIIVDGRERRSATPAQARNFLDAMRGLFRWALEAEHVGSDPTAGVKNPSRPKGDGFAAWSEEDVLTYEARWPARTKERVWLHVLLYTGLRRGDAVRLGRQHVRNGIASIKTEKSGFTVDVDIPILPILEQTLAIGPTGDLAFIAGETGRPLKKTTFGNVFKRACKEAGLGNRSAHGLRKLGATRAADSGATDSELDALFGWIDGSTSKIYTRRADRKRLARQASEKLRNAIPRTLVSGAGNVIKNDEQSNT